MEHEWAVRRWLSVITIAALLAVGIVSVQSVQGVLPSAQALNGSQFDAGNIISDQYFFDDAAMSETEIQAFLQAKIGNCINSNCLNVLRVSTQNKPAKYTGAGVLVCNSYSGAADELASAIIFKVQQACGISAKVLLVTLQKEQGLVTKSSVSSGVLERAMGYGCPDSTGGTCATEYYGFFNQMYWASWQLKRYGTPTVFGAYQPGLNTIKWNPNVGCGASQVNIQDRATAALYNYTPYQPNDAALANLNGIGDSCSSYGNRNFWAYYNDWFGSPTLPLGSPVGDLEGVSVDIERIRLSGWAVDPTSLGAPVNIHIKVDDQWVAWVANGPSPISETRFPGAGTSHGFSGDISTAGGSHRVCVFAVNIGEGANLTLGCQTVVVPDGSPVGEVKDLWASFNSISLWGWAADRDVPEGNVDLQIQANGTRFVLKADQPYPAPTQVLPNAGPRTGFGGTFQVAPGLTNVCVYAINLGKGSNTTLECKVLDVPDGSPKGEWKDAVGVSSGVSMWGWAAEGDSADGTVDIHVRIDTSWYVVRADQPYPAGAIVAPAGGVIHGWGALLPADAGPHQVCAWAVNTGVGSNLDLGCRVVVVPSVISGTGAISVKGSNFELIPGATIEIRKSSCDGAPVWRTTTGATPTAYGAFGISLPNGPYCIVTLSVPPQYGTTPPFMVDVKPEPGNWFTVWLPRVVTGALVAKNSAGVGVNGVTALIREGSCNAPGREVWKNVTATGHWSSGGFGISLPPGAYCATVVDFPAQFRAPAPVDVLVTAPGPIWVTLWMSSVI